MPTIKSTLSILAAIVVGITTVYGQFDPFDDVGNEGEKTETSLVSEVQSIAPGETFSVAIQLSHAPGWHAYYKNPGGPGLPLEFEWKLPEGYEVKQFHWPTPHLYINDGTQFYVYENDYVMLADITAPASAKVGEQATLTVSPSWQICDNKGCDPPNSKELSVSLPVTNASKADTDLIDLFKKARAQLPIENTQWNVSAQLTETQIILSITPKTGNSKTLGNVHFVDDAGITHAEKKQTLKKTDTGYTITAERNPDKAAGDSLTGLLVDETHQLAAIIIRTPLAGGVDLPATASSNAAQGSSASGHGHLSATPSAEDVEEAAKLYDVSQKIDFVLLDGTKEKPLNLVTALGFIFIGGFLLNLMPCVFPVLGIKVMGFAQQAGSEPRKIKFHGLAFMAGLVVSMWVLAGIIYTLIFAFGQDVNWGEQLTSPIFLAAMIMLLYLFGLNMAGVFEIGTSLTGAGGELQSKKGYSGSFFSGILTTLIATPCSGPFLGSVMGYTLKQPPLQGMVIFTVFALGIALPYVVLAFFPKLINKLPRPGAWMVTFKQLMAFALFATAAYFFQSFASITGTKGSSWLLMAIVVAGLAAWAYGRFGTPYTPKTKKYLWGYGFSIAVAAGAFVMTKSATSERAPIPPLTGSSWYPGVVEQNQAKKRIVWVDYTADW